MLWFKIPRFCNSQTECVIIWEESLSAAAHSGSLHRWKHDFYFWTNYFHKLVFEIYEIFVILSYSCFCSPTFMRIRTDGYLVIMITCSDKEERDAVYKILIVYFGLFLPDNDVAWRLLYLSSFWTKSAEGDVESYPICWSMNVIWWHTPSLPSSSIPQLSIFFFWSYDSTWLSQSCSSILVCAVVHLWS